MKARAGAASYYPGETGEFIKVRAERCTACGLCAGFCARGVWVKQGEVYRPERWPGARSAAPAGTSARRTRWSSASRAAARE